MRFYGAVGYGVSTETSPGVWEDVITEVSYYGDITRQARSQEPPSQVPPATNINLGTNNLISFVADDQAYANFTNMRYAVWQGSKWQIVNVEDRRPRLILTLGGLWNG